MARRWRGGYEASGEGFEGEGGGFGVRRPLRFLAYKLELDERQVGELAKILNELKVERAQAEVDHRRTLSAFADAVGGETFDEKRAGDAGQLRVDSAQKLRDAVLNALKKIHALLDPEQREKLPYLIRTGTLQSVRTLPPQPAGRANGSRAGVRLSRRCLVRRTGRALISRSRAAMVRRASRAFSSLLAMVKEKTARRMRCGGSMLARSQTWKRVRSPLAIVSSRCERRALPLGSASSFWPGSGLHGLELVEGDVAGEVVLRRERHQLEAQRAGLWRSS
jgi:Spy/CpxP family protein refolding chaperone